MGIAKYPHMLYVDIRLQSTAASGFQHILVGSLRAVKQMLTVQDETLLANQVLPENYGIEVITF